MGFWDRIARLTDFWEAAQVELHGCYSVKRVRDYVDYSRRTSIFRALFVAAVMPWPCVIITILVDLIPLRSPAEGLHANYEFVVRVFLSFLVASVAVNLQFRHSMPSAPLSNQRVAVTSAITAAQTTSVLYGLSRVVGFPLPFGIITVSPAWVAFLLIPLASFLRKARADPELWPLVLNSLKVWVCQETLVVIYPTYFYIFTTLPQNAKTPFAMLLPIIKMVLRNIMSRTVVHLNDEIPEVVLMNVEVFNSLFMSYCMQNTPSLLTTMGLIVIDGAQMIASMHDVGKFIKRMQIVKDRVNAEHIRQILASSVLGQMPELRRSNILGYAEEILERHCSQQIAEINTASPRIEGPSLTEVLPFNAVLQPNKEMLRKLGKSPSVVLGPMASESVSAHKVFPSPGADVNITDLELQYALNVRKVLYITEFVILINYVEVIVPIIFCTSP